MARVNPRPCAICGKMYQPFFLLVKKQPTCGDSDCKKAWRRKMIENAKPDAITRRCEYCGKMYTSPWRDRQATCGGAECQRQRAAERELELKAERAEEERQRVLSKLKQLRRCRLYDRKRRREREARA